MDTNDILPRVLAAIRRDMADLKADMDERFQRVDERFQRVDERIDRLGEQLGDRITETQMRLSTQIFEVQGTMNDALGMLRELTARAGRRRLPDN